MVVQVGLVWFGQNSEAEFNTVTESVSDQGGYRAARAAKKTYDLAGDGFPYLGSQGKLETGRPNSWDSEGPWASRRVKAPPRRIVEAQRPDPVTTTDPHPLLQAVICLPLTSSLFPSLSCDICR